jgi:hypothetical protein
MADRSMLDAVEYFGRSMNAERASECQPDYTPAEILACWETMYEDEREEWRVSAEVEFISASTTINDDLVKLMVTEWA